MSNKPPPAVTTLWQWIVSYWLTEVFNWARESIKIVIEGVLPITHIDQHGRGTIEPYVRTMMGVDGWVRVPLGFDYATVMVENDDPDDGGRQTALSRMRRCLGVVDYHGTWAILTRDVRYQMGTALILLAPSDTFRSAKERLERFEAWCAQVREQAEAHRKKHKPPGHVYVLSENLTRSLSAATEAQPDPYEERPPGPPGARNARSPGVHGYQFQRTPPRCIRVEGALMFDDLDHHLHTTVTTLIAKRTKGLGAIYGRCANVILVGPPGAGKTTRALKLAYLMGRTLEPRTVATPVDVIGLHEASPNTVMFLDELDRMINAVDWYEHDPDDRWSTRRNAEPKRAVVHGLLKFLDGLEGSNGRVVLMACNSIDGLDEALLSRCVVIHVDPPSAKDCWRYMCEFYGEETSHPISQDGQVRLEGLTGKITLRELAMHCRKHDDIAAATADLGPHLLAWFSYNNTTSRWDAAVRDKATSTPSDLE